MNDDYEQEDRYTQDYYESYGDNMELDDIDLVCEWGKF